MRNQAFHERADQVANAREQALHFLLDLEATHGPRVRYVIESLFGLNGRGRSSAELAFELGMPRSTVKAMKRSALASVAGACSCREARLAA